MKTVSLARLVIWICLAFSLPFPAKAGSLPKQAFIDGFTGHAQSANLSCESRSAVDWAAFWGVRIGEKKFQARLPRSSNPDAGFVGSPNDAWGGIPPASYGVHAGPVAALLGKYGLQAEAQRGLTWDDLRGEIAAGRPVIVWVVGQMWRGYPVKYTAPDGNKTVVARYEHTMVMIGYAPGKVQVVDAYTGEQQTYSLRIFLTSWGTLGRMAVLGGGRTESQPAPSPNDEQENSGQVYLPLISSSRVEAQSLPNPPLNTSSSYRK